VACGEHRDDRFATYRLVGELADDVGVERERDIDRRRAKGGRNLIGPDLFGQKLDLGVVSRERFSERRKGLEASAPVEADAETADLAGSCALRGGDGGVGLGERAPGAGQKRAAGIGQLDLAATSDEQAGTDLLFELADRDAERRLRHPQPLGRPAEVEFFGDGDEIPQVTQLRHEVSVLRCDTRSVPRETESVFRPHGGAS
jgi:hypothetical protein